MLRVRLQSQLSLWESSKAWKEEEGGRGGRREPPSLFWISDIDFRSKFGFKATASHHPAFSKSTLVYLQGSSALKTLFCFNYWKQKDKKKKKFFFEKNIYFSLSSVQFFIDRVPSIQVPYQIIFVILLN